MIITKLIGGLGNQMFQYAAGRRTAVANNTQLKLDITGYDQQIGITIRKYMLQIFRIDEQFASEDEIYKLKNNSLLRKITKKSSYIKEKHFHFDPEILTVSNNVYLEGYWVSEKYFEDIAGVIRKDFTFKTKQDNQNKKLLKQISLNTSISIHVRRGDYAHIKKTHDYHGICDLEYYRRAVWAIGKKIKEPTFYIFSDDPTWCRKNLTLSYKTIYVTHNLGKQDYEDLRLMSACKHNIIANSTFSWWAAWLNKNPDKTVIAPQNWFSDKTINTIDLIPKQWMRI